MVISSIRQQKFLVSNGEHILIWLMDATWLSNSNMGRLLLVSVLKRDFTFIRNESIGSISNVYVFKIHLFLSLSNNSTTRQLNYSMIQLRIMTQQPKTIFSQKTQKIADDNRHALFFIGYRKIEKSGTNEVHFLVKTSWTTFWGFQEYAWIKMDDFSKMEFGSQMHWIEKL